MSTALVTGASSGIGDAFARQLATRGDDLVVVARNADRLVTLARELEQQYGVQVEVLPADLGVPEDLSRVEKRAAEVDLLINNAGYGSNGDFAELPIDSEVAQIEVNVIALVRLAHAALGPMRARGAGGILNVASVAAFQAGPGTATYCATKAFVLSFTESIHEEARRAGVKVTCLAPGFTRTAFQDRAGVDRTAIPGFFWMSADDVAAAGLAALDRNRAVCVTGWPNKAVVVSEHLAPRAVVRRIAGLVTRRL